MSILLDWPVTNDGFADLDGTDGPAGTSSSSVDPPSLSLAKGKGRSNDSGHGAKRMLFKWKTPQPDISGSIRELTNLINTFINELLYYQPNVTIMPTSSFEQIRSACKVLVNVADRPSDVHDKLAAGLTKSLKMIANGLNTDQLNGLEWSGRFVNAMEWMNSRTKLLRSVFADLDGVSCGGSGGKDACDIQRLCSESLQAEIYQYLRCVTLITRDVKRWATSERDTSKNAANAKRLRGKKDDDDQEMIDVDSDLAAHKTRLTITRLIKILTSAGYFHPLFLEPYKASTTSYYEEERADIACTALGANEYFKHCEARLNEESKRLRTLGTTVDETDKLEETLIHAAEVALLPEEVTKKLAPEALKECMQKEDVDGLTRMFDLFRRVHALSHLRVPFGDYVQTRVAEIVTNEEHDATMITPLLKQKAFLDHVLTKAFRERPFTNAADIDLKDNNRGGSSSDCARPFAYAARDAFEKGFLARKRKPAEMIAKYIDSAMRRGQRDESEEVFWSELDDVLGLYRFTQDKDVFRTFYERGLAKRLLLQKSASDALEERVINRLRDGYDPEFGKGNDMFQDIALSRDLLLEYRTLASSRRFEKMSVMVLKFSTWPISKSNGTVNLPSEMALGLASFQQFYKSKHANRQLDWHNALGTVSLTARFPGGDKELSVGLYQAVVLLLFQKEDKLSYKEILSNSGLKPEDLKLTLQSLALGKIQVLKKHPKGKDVGESDEFTVNTGFTDKRRNIHIPGIQQQETVEETKQIEHAIDQDRQASMDAAIVRIMKANKKVTDSDLKMKTVAALTKHFVPTVPDIKRRIDSLIERDYMIRDETNANVYHYVA